jgi:hypothetical protein
LDYGDNVVCPRYQGANGEDEFVVGLFKYIHIIRRATTEGSVGRRLQDGTPLLPE